MHIKIVKYILCILFLTGSCSKQGRLNSQIKQNDFNQAKCQFAIENWIKNHAKFPDSYRPLNYEPIRYHYVSQNGVEVLPLRKYKLVHTFELQDTSENLLVATMDFELQPDFFIDYIHYQEKNVIHLQTRYFPPIYTDWLKQFGRPLTRMDTLEWQIKNRPALYNLAGQFIENRLNRNSKEDIKLADSLVYEINKYYEN